MFQLRMRRAKRTRSYASFTFTSYFYLKFVFFLLKLIYIQMHYKNGLVTNDQR